MIGLLFPHLLHREVQWEGYRRRSKQAPEPEDRIHNFCQRHITFTELKPKRSILVLVLAAQSPIKHFVFVYCTGLHEICHDLCPTFNQIYIMYVEIFKDVSKVAATIKGTC
jgi:hypothetical protein